jgi:ribosome maturation factor RimP
LVDLEAHAGRGGLLRIYIDHEEGVSLADCELVSHQIGAFLDVEDPLPGSYALEVSSPGLDRPLRTLEHFRRFRDEEIRVELKEVRDGRRRLKGRLLGVEGEQILVEADEVTWRLGLAEIAKAQLVPTY